MAQGFHTASPADPGVGSARAGSSGPHLGPPCARWQLPLGVRLHGEVRGSGLSDASYLVERADGQFVHVSRLVNLVLEAAAHEQPMTGAALAEEVSRASGRTLTEEGLHHLALRLAPLGLLRDGAAAAPTTQQASPTPLLALRFRVTLVPAPLVRRVARVLRPLYWPPVMTAAVYTLVLLDVLLWRRADPVAALEQVLATPVFLLSLLALMTLGALVHELGHATASAYGGAAPGRIGFGLYLVFPAFYTDVTTSYRLDRAGRLRTDLGGLYFNVWCLIAAAGGYLLTGSGLLLLVVLLMHLEMAQQLIPTVRFDGYYVLSDLAGVPDLFARVGPVLATLRPGRRRRDEPRVTELRPSARRLITGWVLLVVPTLGGALAWSVWSLPRIVGRTLSAASAQVHVLLHGPGPASAVLAGLSVVLLFIPLAGLALVLTSIVVRTSRWLAARAALRVRQLRAATSRRWA